MLNRKRLLALCFILSVCSLGGNLWSQDASTSQPTVDARLISFDLGLCTSYNVNSSAIPTGVTFGLDFVLTNNMKIGFSSSNVQTLAGPPVTTTTFNLIRFSYYINQLIGFAIGIGTQGTAVAGDAGLFITPIRSGIPGGMFSSLKIKLDYLFQATAGISAGYVTLGLVGSVGL